MVALSSTESELEAMIEGLKKVIWSKRLLEEIELSKGTKIEIRCDNLNAVRLANGGSFKTKSQMLNRKYHHIREDVKKGRYKGKTCITRDNDSRLSNKTIDWAQPIEEHQEIHKYNESIKTRKSNVELFLLLDVI